MLCKIKKICLIGIMIYFVLIVVCCSKKGEKDSIYYMDVIDLTSNVTYDYQNPNYGIISLHTASSYIYKLNGKETYEIVSDFNTIPINLIVDGKIKEKLSIKMIEGITIQVSYKYIGRVDNYDDAIVNFYVLQDGMLVFEDNREGLYYSSVQQIDYIKLKEKIMEF